MAEFKERRPELIVCLGPVCPEFQKAGQVGPDVQQLVLDTCAGILSSKRKLGGYAIGGGCVGEQVSELELLAEALEHVAVREASTENEGPIVEYAGFGQRFVRTAEGVSGPSRARTRSPRVKS